MPKRKHNWGLALLVWIIIAIVAYIVTTVIITSLALEIPGPAWVQNLPKAHLTWT